MHVTLDTMVDTLKAAAESSRLRILVLLSRGDLTVSDLTEILGQSQPRVSRHLKLLLDAGLIGRYQEGSWAFFRLSDTDSSRDFVQRLVSGVREADPQVVRDLERLAAVKRKRQDRAAEYFSENAASWDRIRSLHVPDRAVEAALLKLVGKRPFQSMLDLGTGTGRLLEIFAPLYRRGVGIDMSREMLTVARANLDKAGVANAQVRQGDIFSPPVERNAFDLVTIHQVLHYLDDPARAIGEAAR
ncbi:MAG: metalloregulator ArsR/SmtB family transcription factor, partial [Mesorhizobium sp.]